MAISCISLLISKITSMIYGVQLIYKFESDQLILKCQMSLMVLVIVLLAREGREKEEELKLVGVERGRGES